MDPLVKGQFSLKWIIRFLMSYSYYDEVIFQAFYGCVYTIYIPWNLTLHPMGLEVGFDKGILVATFCLINYVPPQEPL